MTFRKFVWFRIQTILLFFKVLRRRDHIFITFDIVRACKIYFVVLVPSLGGFFIIVIDYLSPLMRRVMDCIFKYVLLSIFLYFFIFSVFIILKMFFDFGDCFLELLNRLFSMFTRSFNGTVGWFVITFFAFHKNDGFEGFRRG